MATTAIKTRIQLKNDTEAHWLLATNFVPLQGEVIIYSADDTHPFSRLKVGDGTTTVNNLPFIDSETVNNYYFANGIAMFPGVGEEHIYYVDMVSDSIYQWENNHYVLKYGLIKQSLSSFFNFQTGTMTNLSVEIGSGALTVNNGTTPSLTINDTNIVIDKGIIV